ncbi:sugar kinase [Streptomyces sp. NPDC051243]|uniref:sugar kinase n=1 Tax=Streptomyces sp. NPDC051243 TaxID=3365646 RepID=UPI0037B7BB68
MTVTGPRNALDVVDVVALGESMVTFLPTRPGRLADVPSFERGIGGAESNVACGLAAAGHAVRWVSRVGADGFGDHLVEAIRGYGVDVASVRRDPARPTGVYFRTAGDRGTDAHEVAYYRAGSAASAMSVENVDLEAVRAGRVLHLSGITAALSEGCLVLMRELTGPGERRPLVSFDVNYRPGLWGDDSGPTVLLDLARRADVVFVGEDEAEAAWGVTGGPEAIRGLLPEPGVLVVKQGGTGATASVSTASGGGLVAPTRQSRICHSPAPLRSAYGSPSQAAGGAKAPGCATRPRPAQTPGTNESAATFVPALHVHVAAATGAGDAFAAGFLSATLRDLPVRDRLRHAHLWAAATLTAPGDLAAPPSRDHADRLAALDDAAWEKLRLGPGWTQAERRADEEVRTP